MWKTGLYVFINDLRISDNPGLQAISSQCDALLCIHISPTRWFKQNHYGLISLGQHRARFLQQSLVELDQQLRKLGQQLHCVGGDWPASVKQIIDTVKPDIIGMTPVAGSYEANDIASVKASVDQRALQWHLAQPNMLFSQSELPFELDNMPDTFSPFRRQIEKRCLPSQAIAAPAELPPPVAGFVYKQPTTGTLPTTDTQYPRLIGGERQAQNQLHYYLDETQALSSYKQTRNELDGWNFSSKLSAWLALGCISPRQVNDAISAYEKKYGANKSTYWLFFELLWREFFYWQQCKHGKRFFTFGGIQCNPPTIRHDETTFTHWCQGNTDYAIVNACMKQLNHTGFMSNRGRQLVASCFVHELGLDWRYGAAYFEQQLIDYDVASNWGNWQYLAGVGSDPRGHRQFNLIKQTSQYDPHGHFMAQWLD